MTIERLCGKDEIASGAAKKFDVADKKIAVIRIEDDFYAIGDTCSHADYSLAEGEVYSDKREIECWKHGSTFSLVTGEPQSLPATEPGPIYRVFVEGDDVMVEL